MKLNPLYLTQVPSCEVTPLPVLTVSPAAPSLLPGRVVENMSNQAYHAHPSLSHSLMKYLEPTIAPLQFWHRSWLNPSRPVDDMVSVGINTGNLLHAAMEDFVKFQQDIACGRLQILPHVKRTQRKGFIGTARGGQLDAVLNLRSRLMAIREVRECMEEGKPEVSLFSEYPLEPWLADIYGQESLTLRCRPDLCSDKVAIHWKFVSRMDPWSLTYLIDRLRYIEGIAHYRHVERLQGIHRRHVIYFGETGGAYEINPIEPSADRLDECQPYGERAIIRFCELHAQYGATQWPDYSHTPRNIYPVGHGGADSLTLPPSYDRRLAA